MLRVNAGMNRPFVKTSIGGIVSLALLYYGVAWAVLRCPHQENQSDQEAVLYDATSYAADISIFFNADQVNIDCTGPKYQTESLAGSSGPTELFRLTRDFGSHVHAFPAFLPVAPAEVGDVWPGELLDKGLSSGISIHLPRYISLSVLRV